MRQTLIGVVVACWAATAFAADGFGLPNNPARLPPTKQSVMINRANLASLRNTTGGCAACVGVSIPDTGSRANLEIDAGQDVADEDITVVIQGSGGSNRGPLNLDSVVVTSSRTCVKVEVKDDETAEKDEIRSAIDSQKANNTNSNTGGTDTGTGSGAGASTPPRRFRALQTTNQGDNTNTGSSSSGTGGTFVSIGEVCSVLEAGRWDFCCDKGLVVRQEKLTDKLACDRAVLETRTLLQRRKADELAAKAKAEAEAKAKAAREAAMNGVNNNKESTDTKANTAVATTRYRVVCSEARPVKVVFSGRADATGRLDLGAGNEAELEQGGNFAGGVKVGVGATMRLSGRVCAGKTAVRGCNSTLADEAANSNADSNSSSDEVDALEVEGTIVVSASAELAGTMAVGKEGVINVTDGARLTLRPPRGTEANKETNTLSKSGTGTNTRARHSLIRNNDRANSSATGGKYDDEEAGGRSSSVGSGSVRLGKGSILEIRDEEEEEEDDSKSAAAGTTSSSGSGMKKPQPRTRAETLRNSTILELSVGAIEGEGTVQLGAGTRVRLQTAALDLRGPSSRVSVGENAVLEAEASVTGTDGAGVSLETGSSMSVKPIWTSTAGLSASRDAQSAETASSVGCSEDADCLGASLAAADVHAGRAITRRLRNWVSDFGSPGSETGETAVSASGALIELNGGSMARDALWRKLVDSQSWLGTKQDADATLNSKGGGTQMCGANWIHSNSTLMDMARAAAVSAELRRACEARSIRLGDTIEPSALSDGGVSDSQLKGFISSFIINFFPKAQMSLSATRGSTQASSSGGKRDEVELCGALELLLRRKKVSRGLAASITKARLEDMKRRSNGSQWTAESALTSSLVSGGVVAKPFVSTIVQAGLLDHIALSQLSPVRIFAASSLLPPAPLTPSDACPAVRAGWNTSDALMDPSTTTSRAAIERVAQAMDIVEVVLHAGAGIALKEITQATLRAVDVDGTVTVGHGAVMTAMSGVRASGFDALSGSAIVVDTPRSLLDVTAGRKDGATGDVLARAGSNKTANSQATTTTNTNMNDYSDPSSFDRYLENPSLAARWIHGDDAESISVQVRAPLTGKHASPEFPIDSRFTRGASSSKTGYVPLSVFNSPADVGSTLVSTGAPISLDTCTRIAGRVEASDGASIEFSGPSDDLIVATGLSSAAAVRELQAAGKSLAKRVQHCSDDAAPRNITMAEARSSTMTRMPGWQSQKRARSNATENIANARTAAAVAARIACRALTDGNVNFTELACDDLAEPWSSAAGAAETFRPRYNASFEHERMHDSTNTTAASATLSGLPRWARVALESLPGTSDDVDIAWSSAAITLQDTQEVAEAANAARLAAEGAVGGSSTTGMGIGGPPSTVMQSHEAPTQRLARALRAASHLVKIINSEASSTKQGLSTRVRDAVVRRNASLSVAVPPSALEAAVATARGMLSRMRLERPHEAWWMPMKNDTASMRRHMHNGTMPPPGGNSSMPPPGGNSTIPPPGGNSTMPPPGGNSTMPPPGGNSTMPPPGGNSTMPPPGGNSTMPPPGGNSGSGQPPRRSVRALQAQVARSNWTATDSDLPEDDIRETQRLSPARAARLLHTAAGFRILSRLARKAGHAVQATRANTSAPYRQVPLSGKVFHRVLSAALVGKNTTGGKPAAGSAFPSLPLHVRHAAVRDAARCNASQTCLAVLASRLNAANADMTTLSPSTTINAPSQSSRLTVEAGGASDITGNVRVGGAVACEGVCRFRSGIVDFREGADSQDTNEEDDKTMMASVITAKESSDMSAAGSQRRSLMADSSNDSMNEMLSSSRGVKQSSAGSSPVGVRIGSSGGVHIDSNTTLLADGLVSDGGALTSAGRGARAMLGKPRPASSSSLSAGASFSNGSAATEASDSARVVIQRPSPPTRVTVNDLMSLPTRAEVEATESGNADEDGDAASDASFYSPSRISVGRGLLDHPQSRLQAESTLSRLAEIADTVSEAARDKARHAAEELSKAGGSVKMGHEFGEPTDTATMETFSGQAYIRTKSDTYRTLEGSITTAVTTEQSYINRVFGKVNTTSSYMRQSSDSPANPSSVSEQIAAILASRELCGHRVVKASATNRTHFLKSLAWCIHESGGLRKADLESMLVAAGLSEIEATVGANLTQVQLAVLHAISTLPVSSLPEPVRNMSLAPTQQTPPASQQPNRKLQASAQPRPATAPLASRRDAFGLAPMTAAKAVIAGWEAVNSVTSGWGATASLATLRFKLVVDMVPASCRLCPMPSRETIRNVTRRAVRETLMHVRGDAYSGSSMSTLTDKEEAMAMAKTSSLLRGIAATARVTHIESSLCSLCADQIMKRTATVQWSGDISIEGDADADADMLIEGDDSSLTISGGGVVRATGSVRVSRSNQTYGSAGRAEPTNNGACVSVAADSAMLVAGRPSGASCTGTDCLTRAALDIACEPTGTDRDSAASPSMATTRTDTERPPAATEIEGVVVIGRGATVRIKGDSDNTSPPTAVRDESAAQILSMDDMEVEKEQSERRGSLRREAEDEAAVSSLLSAEGASDDEMTIDAALKERGLRMIPSASASSGADSAASNHNVSTAASRRSVLARVSKLEALCRAHLGERSHGPLWNVSKAFQGAFARILGAEPRGNYIEALRKCAMLRVVARLTKAQRRADGKPAAASTTREVRDALERGAMSLGIHVVNATGGSKKLAQLASDVLTVTIGDVATGSRTLPEPVKREAKAGEMATTDDSMPHISSSSSSSSSAAAAGKGIVGKLGAESVYTGGVVEIDASTVGRSSAVVEAGAAVRASRRQVHSNNSNTPDSAPAGSDSPKTSSKQDTRCRRLADATAALAAEDDTFGDAPVRDMKSKVGMGGWEAATMDQTAAASSMADASMGTESFCLSGIFCGNTPRSPPQAYCTGFDCKDFTEAPTSNITNGRSMPMPQTDRPQNMTVEYEPFQRIGKGNASVAAVPDSRHKSPSWTHLVRLAMMEMASPVLATTSTTSKAAYWAGLAFEQAANAWRKPTVEHSGSTGMSNSTGGSTGMGNTGTGTSTGTQQDGMTDQAGEPSPMCCLMPVVSGADGSSSFKCLGRVYDDATECPGGRVVKTGCDSTCPSRDTPWRHLATRLFTRPRSSDQMRPPFTNGTMGGGNGTMPPAGGNGTMPPAGGNGTMPPAGGDGTMPPAGGNGTMGGGNGTRPPAGGNGDSTRKRALQSFNNRDQSPQDLASAAQWIIKATQAEQCALCSAVSMELASLVRATDGATAEAEAALVMMGARSNATRAALPESDEDLAAYAPLPVCALLEAASTAGDGTTAADKRRVEDATTAVCRALGGRATSAGLFLARACQTALVRASERKALSCACAGLLGAKRHAVPTSWLARRMRCTACSSTCKRSGMSACSGVGALAMTAAEGRDWVVGAFRAADKCAVALAVDTRSTGRDRRLRGETQHRTLQQQDSDSGSSSDDDDAFAEDVMASGGESEAASEQMTQTHVYGRVEGCGVISGDDVTVENGGVLAPGGAGDQCTLDVGGDLTMTTGSSVELAVPVAAGSVSGIVTVGGLTVLGNGSSVNVTGSSAESVPAGQSAITVIDSAQGAAVPCDGGVMVAGARPWTNVFASESGVELRVEAPASCRELEQPQQEVIVVQPSASPAPSAASSPAASSQASPASSAGANPTSSPSQGPPATSSPSAPAPSASPSVGASASPTPLPDIRELCGLADGADRYCDNQASCTLDAANGYAPTCQCRFGFSGVRCTVAPVDPCDGVGCGNGVCAAVGAGAAAVSVCVCDAGYSKSTTTGSCTVVPESATCDDGLHNQDETDIDCGGVCGGSCQSGLSCATSDDCASALVCGDLSPGSAGTTARFLQSVLATDGVCTPPTRPRGVSARVDNVQISGVSVTQFLNTMASRYVDHIVANTVNARDAIITQVKEASAQSRRGRSMQSSSGVVVDTEIIFYDFVTEAEAASSVVALTTPSSAGSGSGGGVSVSLLESAVTAAATSSGLGSSVTADVSAVTVVYTTRTEDTTVSLNAPAPSPSPSPSATATEPAGLSTAVLAGLAGAGAVLVIVIGCFASRSCKAASQRKLLQSGQSMKPSFTTAHASASRGGPSVTSPIYSNPMRSQRRMIAPSHSRGRD